MRIIAGKAKGRILKSPSSKLTRPTSDRVKEALFSIIGPFFSGGIVLDLYAGTGALGFESLSRGIEKVIFVDKNREAIKIIKENAQMLDFCSQIEVFHLDVKIAFELLHAKNIKFDYIFIDPPYKERNVENLFVFFAEYDMLENDGKIIVEHEKKYQLPESIKNFVIKKRSIYGDTIISIYSKSKE